MARKKISIKRNTKPRRRNKLGRFSRKPGRPRNNPGGRLRRRNPLLIGDYFGIYRTPGQSDDSFFQELREYIIDNFSEEARFKALLYHFKYFESLKLIVEEYIISSGNTFDNILVGSDVGHVDSDFLDSEKDMLENEFFRMTMNFSFEMERNMTYNLLTFTEEEIAKMLNSDQNMEIQIQVLSEWVKEDNELLIDRID